MTAAPAFQPLYLDGTAGRLFAVYYPPAADRDRRRAAVFAPPFAEEMNRARRMTALLGRRLAGLGIGLMVVDPIGTGDSDGDFADGGWRQWRDDLATAATWLRGQGVETVDLVGLRLGAALALDLARNAVHPIGRIVLWQPVTSGKVMFNQFLRIALAASMGESDRVTTTALRQRLAAGETLEVAGYALTPGLAAEIEAVALETLAPPAGTDLAWLEVSSAAAAELSPAGRKVIDAWRGSHGDIPAAVVAGEPFWAIQEVTVAPALVEATATLYAEAV